MRSRRADSIRLILLALFFIFPVEKGRAEFEAGALAGVVRVEMALDPFSTGPKLVRELSQQTSLSPFQAELLRRLSRGSSGSAFCVSPGLLLTTAHVVLAGARYPGLPISPSQWASLEAAVIASSKPWLSTGSSGSGRIRRPGEVLALDREKDLSLIYCPDLEDILPPFRLADSRVLREGMRVVVVGYAREGLRVARGEVKSLIRGRKVGEPARVRIGPGRKQGPIVLGASEGEIVRIQHSASTEAGVSGAPLLNEEGMVIGVAYALLKPTGAKRTTSVSPSLHLAIAGSVVEEFLQEHRMEIRTPRNGGESGRLSPGEFAAAEREPPTAGGEGDSYGSLPARPSPQELEKVDAWIRRGNAAAAIPLLQARLRRDRQDFRARALLARAHYQQSRSLPHSDSHLLAALYHFAWLTYFAPETPFAEDARPFLEKARIRERAFRHLLPPDLWRAKALLLSLKMQERLSELLKCGALTETIDSTRQEMSRRLAECEDACARTNRADGVVEAALIQAYLALEETCELAAPLPATAGEKLLRERAALLNKALQSAQPLAHQLERSPGAQALLGLVCVRLGRLQRSPALLEKARRAYEKAYGLDSSSPSAISALAAFPSKSLH